MTQREFAVLVLPSTGVTFVPSPRYLQDEAIEEVDAAAHNVVDERRFWSRVQRRFGIDAADLAAMQEQLAFKYCRNLNVWSRLPQLHKRFRLALLHSGPSVLLPYWRERYGYDRFFEHALTTGDLGLTPASPDVYRHLAISIGVPTAACFVVHDELEPYLAAREAGCSAYRWGSAYGLMQALEAATAGA
jgi:FMN phosphatase YigB (HAD superfamily)